MSNVAHPQPGTVAHVLGAALDGLTDAELRQHIARAAGIMAHREGDAATITVLCRVAGAISVEGRRQ